MAWRRYTSFAGLLLFTHWLAQAAFESPGPPGDELVGPSADGGWIVPTGQKVRPAGTTLAFPGRPVDLVLSADGANLFVKDNRGLLVFDAAAWKERQRLLFPDKDGASMHGLALSRDGKRLYATTAQRHLHEAEVDDKGLLAWRRAIELPGPEEKGAAHALGIALTRDGRRAFVCLSRNNTLGIVDLDAGTLVRQIDTGVAPYGIALSADEKFAYISNWGGRRPGRWDRTAPSSGTATLVDERGVAASGTVMKIDLDRGAVIRETPVGLHPAGILLSPDAATLYVANANSDTVSILRTDTFAVTHTVLVRPDASLPFGSATNALALSADGKTLYACNGGNNAVAVIALDGDRPLVRGFVPTGWYPGAVAVGSEHLYVANVKGEGSRTANPKKLGWNSHLHRGSVSKIALPDGEQLRDFTAQVRADSRVPQILAALEKRRPGHQGSAGARAPGEPSLFEHVVYVIKENRTYDQVLGDLKQGNGDPKLCIFGANITPNLHALAQEFVLLDNFYCNGVLSADGHSWAIEGNATDHLEKQFGGFTQLYLWRRPAGLFLHRLSLGQRATPRPHVSQLW